MILKKIVLLSFIMMNSSSFLGQNIFHSDYKMKKNDLKSINEINGDRIFSQLVLSDNGSFILNGYSYRTINKKEFVINCSERKGQWIKKNNRITLTMDNNITVSGSNTITFLQKKEILIPKNSKGKYSKNRSKYRLVDSLKVVTCPELVDKPTNDINDWGRNVGNGSETVVSQMLIDQTGAFTIWNKVSINYQ